MLRPGHLGAMDAYSQPVILFVSSSKTKEKSTLIGGAQSCHGGRPMVICFLHFHFWKTFFVFFAFQNFFRLISAEGLHRKQAQLCSLSDGRLLVGGMRERIVGEVAAVMKLSKRRK